VINPIDSTQAAGATRESGRSSSSTATSFDAVLSAAKKKSSVPASELKPPKGEKWEPVAGHNDYADIVAGKRNGFFVNLAPGPRQGEAFHIVKRDGRTFHVYGEGRNREVIEVKERIDPSKVKPQAGETFADVKGHRDYKEIDGGKRDGLHVNLSGNERTGKAFKLVTRGDRTLHIYGEGRDREVIEVGWRKKRAAEETGESKRTGTPDAAKGE
jgi:hypothetical protein